MRNLAILALAALLAMAAGAQEIVNPITNQNFETGDLTGWTIESASVSGVWGLGDQTGKEGSYAVRSAGGFTGVGEDNTGVLVSDAFTMPALPDGSSSMRLTFLIAGHRGEDIATGALEDIEANRKNYVVICSAADDSELTGHVWPPRSDTMAEDGVDVTALVGQDVYIKVVDDSTKSGFSWIAVDNFGFEVPPEPAGINGNGNFETGDLTGWSVFDAGTGAWDGQPSAVGRSGREGAYAVSSFPAGENKTGALRSDTFTIPSGATQLKFLIAGHYQYAGDPNNMGDGTVESPWNYVSLNLADGTEVDRVYAPGNDAFQPRIIDVATLVGEDVYVDIVDNADATGYAWMAADDFRLTVSEGPTCEEWTCNAGFELGDYSGWVVGGDAWGPLPSYQSAGYVAVDEGDYCAATNGNENLTGTLSTNAFEVTADMFALRYNACGWSSPDGNPDNGLQYNYAMLKSAADDSDLLGEKLFVGNPNDVWTPFEIDLTPFVGQTVYLQFIDDSTGGYAWMCVDAVSLYDATAWNAEDADGDGLTNGEETGLGTDPDAPDSDGDGLYDGAEVNLHGTNPLLADSDDDGFSDQEEIAFGTDPLDPNDFPENLPVGGLAALMLLAAAVVAIGVRRMGRAQH